MNATRHLTIIAALLMFLSACQSPEIRHSDEDFRSTPDLTARNITEISVLPFEIGPAVASESITDRQLPARKMRRMVRGYLIERKNYAVPSATWIDDRLNESSSLETDALLNVSVLQWDTSSLEKRGVIYATATFELKSPDGNTLLWRYSCRDFQLVVDAPYGGQAIGGNNLTAARLLAETALSRLPRK